MTTYTGTARDDTLIGADSDDTLLGLAGNDSLRGGDGDDELDGGAGNDTLAGGRGFNTLMGGAGDDTYLVDHLDDEFVEAPGEGFDTLVVAVNGFKVFRDNIERVTYVNDALALAYWVDALVYGFSYAPMGTATSLTFGFPESGDAAGYAPFDASDRELARSALQAWAASTQLTLREVPSEQANQADIVFGFAELQSRQLAGVTYVNDSGHKAVIQLDLAARGGALARDAAWREVLLHEIGHALGLKHPGDYNGVDGQGTAPFLNGSEDHAGLSVMSYNDAPGGPPTGYGSTLRPFDVAAIQYLYGVSPVLSAGDTNWQFTQLAGANAFISDGGGVDTLNASDIAPAGPGLAWGIHIDLRSGARNFQQWVSGEFALMASSTHVTINYGSVIENAIGSALDDWIFGNQANNQLVGGSGHDQLFGSGGDDTLSGGDGNDTLDGGSGLDNLQGGGGDDELLWTLGQPTTVTGGSGRDVLRLKYDAKDVTVELYTELTQLVRALSAAPDAVATSAVLALHASGIESLQYERSDGWRHAEMPVMARPAQLALDEGSRSSAALPAGLDVNGGALIYFLDRAPRYGVAQLSEQGVLSYAPFDINFHGSDSLSYVVGPAAGGSLSMPATVDITVRPVDDTPFVRQILPDASAVVGQPFAVSLPASTFADIDSTTLSYRVQQASGAVLPAWLSFDPSNGRLSGLPGPADVALLQLRASASDGHSSASDDFLLGVHLVANRAPQGPVQTLGLDEDTPLRGTVQGVSDADGDPLGTVAAIAPAHGRVTVSASGAFDYTPEANYHGADSFSLMVSDGRGGSLLHHIVVDVRPVNDAPTGQVTLGGTARMGFTLNADAQLADIDGIGPLTLGWLRNGQLIAGATALSYQVTPEDVGATLAAQFSWIDGGGTREVVVSAASVAVPPPAQIVGTVGADMLSGGPGPDALFGLQGDDTLIGNEGGDTLDGGEGQDLLYGGKGSNTINGGAGFDVLSYTDIGLNPLTLDLTKGVATSAAGRDELSGIEGVIAGWSNDLLIGLDGPETLRGETFRPLRGNDTVLGGSGVDTVEFEWVRAAYALNPGSSLVVTDHSFLTGQDTLLSIERLRFADTLLAFGTRAEEVAKVAFALWSKDIALAKDLFAKGISYYDNGYSYTTLVKTALTYFGADSDAQLAQRLVANVPSTHSAAALLTLIAQQGGGDAGRAYITQLMADEVGNMANIELAGLRSQGIECSLVVDGVMLFAAMAG